MVDEESHLGRIGWSTVAGIKFPHIYRNGRSYVSVQMVEQKLLSKYPREMPPELERRGPLNTFHVTQTEANLLNEINKKYSNSQFGLRDLQPDKDALVEINDFVEFYKCVKDFYPNVRVHDCTLSTLCHGGWLQIHNTVVPYVWRGSKRYVPLQVIRYAAGLLSDKYVEQENLNQEECKFLNRMCKEAGLTFEFESSAKVICESLLHECGAKIIELPAENPFRYATYIDEESSILQPELNSTRQSTSVTQAHSVSIDKTATNRQPLGQLLPNTSSPAHSTRMVAECGGSKQARVQSAPTSSVVHHYPHTAYNLTTSHVTQPTSACLNQISTVNSTLSTESVMPRTTASAPHSDSNAYKSASSQFPRSPIYPTETVSHPSPLTGVEVAPGIPVIPYPISKHSGHGYPSNAGQHANAPTQLVQRAGRKRSFPSVAEACPRMKNTCVAQHTASASSQQTTLSILPDKFRDKSLSCMHCTSSDGKIVKVALVEALVQVCFHNISADQFVDALSQLFNISLEDCTREEELAFINFYTLPTQQLRCRKKMPLSCFNEVYDALQSHFQSPRPSVKQESGETMNKLPLVDGVVDLT